MMLPSSKTKQSVATRRVPPPANARRAEGGAQSPAATGSAQKFMWPEDRRERIAAKAYELWEQRGCRHGHDLEDWFDAEALVIQSLQEPPK